MMTVAVRPTIGSIHVGDTAELTAYLRINEQPVTQDQVLAVTFTIELPDETQQIVPGIIQTDGSGFLRWATTTQVGEYRVQAQFQLGSGEIRSVMLSFSVTNPFDVTPDSATELITDQVMMRLEDAFDSMDGGPWLKDRTMAHFDAAKIASFIPEALLDINVQMPPTNFTLDSFTLTGDPTQPNPNMPILVKGVLVLTIRHLMRSYTENWVVTGGQVVQPDRTRYQQMWGQMYQIEYQDYIQAVRLWKRTVLNLGRSALLTSSKAGRLYPYGAMRTRGAQRGYY